MGRKSEYSDEYQREMVGHLKKFSYESIRNSNIDATDKFPSKRTTERWIEKWTPIMEAEEKAESIIQQKKAQNRHNRQNYKIVRRKNSKYNMPNFTDLKVFLEDHEGDSVMKKVWDRIFGNKKDAGTYRDFYYVIEEMNKG